MRAARMLNRGRVRAESLHSDTFAVLRPTGGFVQNPVTYEREPEYLTVHAEVFGKFQFGQLQPRTMPVPGVVAVGLSGEWHTSVRTYGVRLHDVVRCVAVDAEAGDPELVGKEMQIDGPFLKAYATARRFPVKEVE